MDKVLQYIGISQKSRHLISGTDAVIDGLKHNKLYIIFLASNASSSLQDKILKKAHFYSVDVIQKYDSMTLSRFLKKEYVILGIDDLGIANAIKEIIKEDKSDES